MIISNVAVWTFFVKALQQSNSSLATTITSTATNYIYSVSSLTCRHQRWVNSSTMQFAEKFSTFQNMVMIHFFYICFPLTDGSCDVENLFFKSIGVIQG